MNENSNDLYLQRRKTYLNQKNMITLFTTSIGLNV